MPSKPIESTPDTAVDEAIRTLTEASQRGTAGAQRVVATSHSLFNDSLTINGQMLQSWSTGLEALLKASFELQNSVLGTAPALLDSFAGGQTSVLKAWTTMAKQQQATTLSAFHTSVEATEKLLVPTKS